MPRFHLHLWDCGNFIADDEGVELPDEDAALTIAERTLTALLCEDVRVGRTQLNRCIVIADGQGRTLAELSTAQILSPSDFEAV
jgi:hypothetical protein